MKKTEIIAAWKIDSHIDDKLDVDDLVLMRNMSLHSKYVEWLSHAEDVRRGLEVHRKNLWRKLYDYYRGASTEEDLKELGKEQNRRRLSKSDANEFIETDSIMIELERKLDIQLEKVRILTDIVRQIGFRNNSIGNIMSWRKFTAGG